jgi:tRNA (mo5U34)-methyltransferase
MVAGRKEDRDTVSNWQDSDASLRLALGPMVIPEELQEQADALKWFHCIDLGNGVVTKGDSTEPVSAESFPEFDGRSVLDIGAWDGYYAFLAERGGASRVVALDNYAWGVDFEARNAYWNSCFLQGALPDHSLDLTRFWSPDLPGRRAFEFAASTLGSKVEPRVGDFTTMDLEEIGEFDVVLYLGVLYHMEEPLTCLKRVRSVTREVAVIETEAIHFQFLDHESLFRFHSGGDLHIDFGNWFVPTINGLHALCRAAGFSSTGTAIGPPPVPPVSRESLRTRVGRRIGRIERRDHISTPSCRYRAVVHARV